MYFHQSINWSYRSVIDHKCLTMHDWWPGSVERYLPMIHWYNFSPDWLNQWSVKCGQCRDMVKTWVQGFGLARVKISFLMTFLVVGVSSALTRLRPYVTMTPECQQIKALHIHVLHAMPCMLPLAHVQDIMSWTILKEHSRARHT
jgi:hypothetical protein